ncbi:MAG: succinate dehydrogenase cytochrome b subunit [Rhodothermales bacterium]|nr:succinate dehydrogenase cytochrome b subunit [Rhodothermales bacterium]
MANSGRKLKMLFSSAVGRKVLTGITGLGLTLFVLGHMLGNLSFFSSDPNAYNSYSHALISLGPLLYAVELGLLAFVVVHIAMGVKIYLGKKAARPVDYAEYKSAGGPSRQSVSSRTMIVTGLVLMVFLVLHILSFKYGPGIDEGYVVTVNGEEIRDLKRLLIEKFQSPLYAFGYPAVMLLLGFHLRHGIWSALQSLGAMTPRLTPLIYTAGGILAALIAVGFLVLPLWIFFGGGSA